MGPVVFVTNSGLPYHNRVLLALGASHVSFQLTVASSVNENKRLSAICIFGRMAVFLASLVLQRATLFKNT